MKEEMTSENMQKIEGENNTEKEKTPPEIIDQLPPQVKRLVAAGLSIQSYSGPLPPQFFEKINEDHISKILEIAEKDDERSFNNIESSRKYNLSYVLIFVGLFVFLTIFLINKDIELYKEVLKIIVAFSGGFGGGFGFSEWKRRR